MVIFLNKGINMGKTMGTIKDLKANISKVIVGKEETITMVLVSMLSGGHVLLEDMPGSGKTLLARSLSKSISGQYNRIQFTPDLLPSDVTGLSVYNAAKGDFQFKKGPVFCNILLADEINRATPRTQAGLLECMEEYQVTTDGETRPLPDPFFVIATQNPIETSGTFPLPEAQLDRFIMKLSMGFPNKNQELLILERFNESKKDDILNSLSSVLSPEDISSMKKEVLKITVHPSIMEYITDIIMATRDRDDVVAGISPRGSLALLHCSKALAFIEERSFVTPEDVKRVAPFVLSHRLILNGGYGQKNSGESIISSILSEVKVPTEEF